MRKYDFLLTYDIADPKRLRKIARRVERRAMRLQYSVYVLFDTTPHEVTKLLDEILKLIHEEQDDIRVYKIKHKGIHMRAARDLEHPYDFFQETS